MKDKTRNPFPTLLELQRHLVRGDVTAPPVWNWLAQNYRRLPHGNSHQPM
jgi:hypothetical protein